MQLRNVDPRILLDNPNNPRRTAAHAVHDQQLIASIRDSNGPLQPPTVREQPDGTLMIVYGHRRKYASIAAGLPEIFVLVRGADETGDGMAAFAENMIRTGMCSVDIWRAIEGLVGQGYTEEGIGTALSIPIRTIRKLRLFAGLLPAMLERMAQGDEPNEGQLRVIASATRDEQAAAWKKHKPKKTEQTSWHMLEHALRKIRVNASVGAFDDQHAEAFGIHWTEDLFAEGKTDPRFTDQVELFFTAQQAWLEQHLPSNGEMLELTQWGEGKLPPKAQEIYGSDKKRKDLRIGFWVCNRTGEVRQKLFQYPQPVKQSAGQTVSGTGQGQKTPRADVSGKGLELIGTYRTEALHQALKEGENDDAQLIGMLILALDARNVTVQQDYSHYQRGTRRSAYVRAISEGGIITQDLDTLRSAARGMLRTVLSCEVGRNGSGETARIAGATVHAEVYLPNMATDDFLPKLSKDGITKVLQAEKLLPRNTGKEMRAALIEHVGTGSYVHPAALFELTPAELAERARRAAEDQGAEGDDKGADAPDDGPGADEDDVEQGGGGEDMNGVEQHSIRCTTVADADARPGA